MSILGSTLEQRAQQDKFISGQFASSQLLIIVTIHSTSTDYFTSKQRVLHSRLTRLLHILLRNEEPCSPVFDQPIKPEDTTHSLTISDFQPVYVFHMHLLLPQRILQFSVALSSILRPLVAFGEQRKWWSPFLCNCLHHLIMSCLLYPNVFLSSHLQSLFYPQGR